MSLYISYLEDLLARLSSKTPGHLIQEDLWRLNNNWYGPYALCGTLNTTMVDIGGRSGIFGILLATNNPASTVIIVERDISFRSAIAESVMLNGIENIKLCASVNEAWSVIGDSQRELGLFRVEGSYFDKELICHIASTYRIDCLIGEFREDKVNILWLHRISREIAKYFHWKHLGCQSPIVGRSFHGPDVSVVVPAYGVEGCLDQCLESLAIQTLDSLEIIVVDDGARDRSGKIADDWAKRDARIRVIHQPNAGCAASRSNGMKAARGMFIGFVDGDDWVDAPMFQALAESAVRFNSDIAQCGFRHFYQSDNTSEDEREYFDLSIKRAEGEGLVTDPQALIPMKPSIWRRIYRRDFLVDNELDFSKKLRRFDDTPFHFKTLALAQRLSVINACYYNYRQQRPGQDINVNDERLYIHFPIFKILKDFVKQYYSPKLEELLFKTQVASHHWAGSIIKPELLKIYIAAAKYDMFGDRVALTPGELLKSVRTMDSRRARWARSMRYRIGSGEDAWFALKDYAK